MIGVRMAWLGALVTGIWVGLDKVVSGTGFSETHIMSGS
jgi:hypothetical protein